MFLMKFGAKNIKQFYIIIKIQEGTFFFDAILLHRNVKIKTDALRYIISVFLTSELSRELLNVSSCAKCIYCVILSYHSPIKEYQFSLPYIVADPMLHSPP